MDRSLLYINKDHIVNKYFILIILSTLLFSSCSNYDKNKKPNIVLINIDDLGWKDLEYMGSDFYETPNIDLLSKQGMIFTNGYASASNCAPSRASLLTGRWTPRHGIYTVASSERGESKNRKLIPIENTTTLSNGHIILSEILKNNGYATGHAGKWHLSNKPLLRGFDANIGGSHAGHPTSYYPPYGNVDLEVKNDEYLTDLIMAKAIQFIKSTEQPFLLYYAPYAVHTPIQPVDSLIYKYEDKSTKNGQKNIKYASMIDNLDRNIGLLISTLNDLGIIDNTFIVLTSDNGGLFGITDQSPLRAGKGSYYEGGIRVPFAFVWKGEIPTNNNSDIPITNLDLFPTLLDVAKINSSGYEFDGESILPILKGEKISEPRPLFWHFPIYLEASSYGNNSQNRDPLFRTRPGSVVRFGDWKLHHYFEDDGIELYNLKEDIGEKRNLVNDYPKKVEELLTLLNNWRKEVNAPVPSLLNPDYELK